MSWWGKVLGGSFGFMMGGPLGALLGAAVGHGFDSGLKNVTQAGISGASVEQVQAAFFTATFTVMGKLAKADGRVSETEIQSARAVMRDLNLNQEQSRVAMELFNQGKQPDFKLTAVMDELQRVCGRRRNLLQMFLEVQIQVALADGDLHPAEQQLLLDISRQLGFSALQFQKMLAMALAQRRYTHGGRQSHGQPQQHSQQRLHEAYEVLGVSKDSSDQAVKKAYRRLMSQHHPDKLVAKGLPEEMMKLATERTQKIKDAYEEIKQARSN